MHSFLISYTPNTKTAPAPIHRASQFSLGRSPAPVAITRGADNVVDDVQFTLALVDFDVDVGSDVEIDTAELDVAVVAPMTLSQSASMYI